LSTLPSPDSPVDLRPLAMGELVDRSAHAWRRHFGAFFRMYLVFQLGLFCAAKLFELAMGRWFPLVRGGEPLVQAMSSDTDAVLVQYAWGLGLGTVLVLFSVWAGWAVGVAASHYFIRRHLGEQVTLRDGFTRLRRTLPTLTLAFGLSMVWVAVALVAALLPGALLMAATVAWASHSPTLMLAGVVGATVLLLLGLLAAVLLYLLRFLFTVPVMAMEDVGAVQALRRSGSLVSGRIGPGVLNWVKVRATLLLTMVSAILLVVATVTGLPAMLVQLAYASPLDPLNANPAAVPQLLMVPAQLLQVVAQAAFSPLFLVFSALFYVDMRVRREGLDLELKLAP
jgi:hypothetical protein